MKAMAVTPTRINLSLLQKRMRRMMQMYLPLIVMFVISTYAFAQQRDGHDIAGRAGEMAASHHENSTHESNGRDHDSKADRHDAQNNSGTRTVAMSQEPPEKKKKPLDNDEVRTTSTIKQQDDSPEQSVVDRTTTMIDHQFPTGKKSPSPVPSAPPKPQQVIKPVPPQQPQEQHVERTSGAEGKGGGGRP